MTAELSAVVVNELHHFPRPLQKYSKRTVNKRINSVLRNHYQFTVCDNVLIELDVI
jgi:hypothetical protein